MWGYAKIKKIGIGYDHYVNNEIYIRLHFDYYLIVIAIVLWSNNDNRDDQYKSLGLLCYLSVEKSHAEKITICKHEVTRESCLY